MAEDNGKPKVEMVNPNLIQLLVTLDQSNGQINVTGPIQNAMLCYGLLEAAKDVVRTFNANAALQKNNIILPFLKGVPRGA